MKWLLLLLLLLGRVATSAAEAWPQALSRMPLLLTGSVLNHSNCAPALLDGFQSNATAKALLFMPGATDELFFFRRVAVVVTNAHPSLLDAVVALTNQSPLRLTYRPPFLLLHSAEDVLALDFRVEHPGTEQKLRAGKPISHVMALDRDWTQLLRMVQRKIPATLLPYEGTTGSWHFYRHTFAGWHLTPWEMMEAAAFAGKTRFTVIRRGVVFEVDSRVGAVPQLDRFPGR